MHAGRQAGTCATHARAPALTHRNQRRDERRLLRADQGEVDALEPRVLADLRRAGKALALRGIDEDDDDDDDDDETNADGKSHETNDYLTTHAWRRKEEEGKETVKWEKEDGEEGAEQTVRSVSPRAPKK